MESVRTDFYLDGAWVPADGRQSLEVHNTSTEQVIGTVPAGTADDVDRAVAAARAAFEGWAATDPVDRAAHLDRLHAELTARAGDIAHTVATELGTPLKVATRVQVGLPLTVLRSYVDLAAQPPAPQTVGNSLVVREPVGVIGAITPWNYPLHQIVAKLAPALAAGCTLVLKPSELTPLTAYLLFDAIDAASLPPGVVNLVTGTGPIVGEALAGHPDVDLVSFTGSTATGRRIAHLAADRIARVALELGGKSANVILDDADLTAAVKVGVGNAMLNSGQTCTAWTRMLVHRDRYDEALDLAATAVAGYRLGDPFDPATRLGPLVSAAQRDRVREHIARGLADGGRLVVGGPDAPVPSRGWFVAPTIIADVDPDSALAQEEVFGPVLAVIPVDDDDHAVRVANNSRYGLAGAVWSTDEERAVQVARRLRTGAVDINGAPFNPLAPFGGYKQSGLGRELGTHGLAEFCELKAIQR
ncbi:MULTISPECIES: aldehyde dehydrogenase family protein [Micromonospora]|uniref:Aldehyde dehydrogenase n=1 Tax=Micromonospora maris TaxID=1003110 RepID=A0A9X0HZS7_9ACTN|nr:MULTISPECIES: aldehyde dehydrogenase family protein [Micromonospora]AEB44649.1 aldehyde dehydrogenase [Micromonospora maris AB-18-032]KUJ44144.1 aldehyde dehydrogenase [Micromonospora maris]RUL90196.1 aldehyde dehydrogenase family protein [Verrucosispora sp. FIM060022]